MAVGRIGGAAVMQRFVIAPNEQVRETPFIEHNIAATRKAFALDDVEERELSGDAPLTRADIDANDATLGNVRLWDHQPLLQTFAQIQEIRTYYDFVSVHNDRYRIDGAYRQIMLSARELNSDSLPNRNWINERLTFTHGYGVDAGAGQPGHAGRPAGAVHQGPSAAVVGRSQGRRSRASTTDSCRTTTCSSRPKRASSTTRRARTTSTRPTKARGGVPMSNFLRRLLFSIRFRSFKVLLSEDITNESRVMFHRRLSERVARIAPFLQYDPDPVPGHLERPSRSGCRTRYTTSGRYPYSTPAPNGINYIRNSVKATVDAYHGTVAFYLIDETDPIALTLQRIFPTLFRPLGGDAGGHAHAAALSARASSRCRRRCTRPTT